MLLVFLGSLYNDLLVLTHNLTHKLLSHVQLFVTSCTVACQAPLSMGFSRQEYWSRLLFPSPRDLPSPRTEPRSSQPTDWTGVSHTAGRFFTTWATREIISLTHWNVTSGFSSSQIIKVSETLSFIPHHVPDLLWLLLSRI